MPKTVRILVLILLLEILYPHPSAHAALGDHLWSKGWDGGGLSSPDGSGYIASAGNFFGSLDLGGGVFTPGNIFGGDVFLARFDNDGNHVWSQQFTPGGFGCNVTAVAAAPDGSIYMAGFLQNGDIDFGGGTLSGPGVTVLAAFEPNGSHRWSFSLGNATVKGLSASNGTLACTGYTQGSLDFGGGTMTSAGGTDVFVGVLNADGSHRFSAIYGDTGNQGGMGIAVDNSEGIVLAASTETTIDFGGGVLTPSGADLCLVAFNSAGAHQWSWNRAGDFSPGSGILMQLDLAVSSGGDIAVAGQFQGATDLGGGVLNAMGSDDIYLAIYDAGGAHLSSQAFGGTSGDGAQGVDWDSAGNLALSGYFLSPSFDFGGAALTHSGGFGQDWCHAVFDDSGTHLYSRAFTGNGQYTMSMDFNSNGDLLLHGSGGGNTDFGGGPVASMGFFLATLEGEGGTVTDAPPALAGARLAQNSPNPFNPRTTIRFQLENDAMARLEIYDVAGRRVRTLVDERMSAGEHAIAFDGRDSQGQALASGIYRYRLQSGASSLVKSMVLLK